MARWFLTLEAVNPRDVSKRWKVGVHEQHYKRIQNYGHESKLARIILVHETLLDGLRSLYRGWSRPGKNEGYFVYVGFPEHDYQSRTIEKPAPTGMCFLVFVLPDGTIDDWVWRELDADGRPSGVSGELIWTKPI